MWQWLNATAGVLCRSPWPVRIANKGLHLPPTVSVHRSVFHTQEPEHEQVNGLMFSSWRNGLWTNQNATSEGKKIRGMTCALSVVVKVRMEFQHHTCFALRTDPASDTELSSMCSLILMQFPCQIVLCAVRCGKCSLKPGYSHLATKTLKKKVLEGRRAPFSPHTTLQDCVKDQWVYFTSATKANLFP